MQRFKNILALASGDGENDAAIDQAIWLARANDARLTLMDVLEQERGTLTRLLEGMTFSRPEGAPDRALSASDVENAVIAARREALEALAERARAAGVATDTAMRAGPLFVTAIRDVLRNGRDLVMKTASPSADHVFLSDDLHLMRKAPCPVWIVQDGVSATPRVLLAAVDPDPDDATRDALNHNVMKLATSLAERTGSELHVVNAWRLQEEQALRSPRVKVSATEVDEMVERERQKSEWRLMALLRDFPDPTGRRVVVHRKGWGGDVAPLYAAEIRADMIVMGTVGRTGIEGLIIGNTAESILTRVHCSAMTVKPSGFVSPVALPDEDEPPAA